MNSDRNQFNENERMVATVVDATGALITGDTVLLEILREVDKYYLDFADNKFKNAGWTTRQVTMTELDAVNFPGTYYYDWDVSTIGMIGAQRNYMCRATSAAAANSPIEGRLKLGGWIDSVNLASGFVPNQTGGKSTFTKAQADYIAERVWKYILNNKKSAEEMLLTSAQFDAAAIVAQMPDNKELKSVLKDIRYALDGIELDNTPVLDAIKKIKVIDYSKLISDISAKLVEVKMDMNKNLSDIKGTVKLNETSLNDKVDKFQNPLKYWTEANDKMEVLKEEVSIMVDELRKQFQLETELSEGKISDFTKVVNDKLGEINGDIKKQLDDLKRQTAIDVTSNRYEIMKEFTQDMMYIRSKLETL